MALSTHNICLVVNKTNYIQSRVPHPFLSRDMQGDYQTARIHVPLNPFKSSYLHVFLCKNKNAFYQENGYRLPHCCMNNLYIAHRSYNNVAKGIRLLDKKKQHFFFKQEKFHARAFERYIPLSANHCAEDDNFCEIFLNFRKNKV